MNYSILVFSLCFSAQLFAADIIGKWQSIDDVTKQPKSVVEITQAPDGTVIGKIIKLFPNDAENNKRMCDKCEGELKSKPILGMQIIKHMKADGDEYSGGTILDPKNGKEYKCILKRDGLNLIVRGYVGISLIGRSQTWIPYNE